MCLDMCRQVSIFFYIAAPKKHSGTNHQMKRKICLKCLITVHSHSSTASFLVVELFLILQNTETDTKLICVSFPMNTY